MVTYLTCNGAYKLYGEYRLTHNNTYIVLVTLLSKNMDLRNTLDKEIFIEKNEMGGACGTYGGRERGAQGSGGET